jgi:hypothetical protein
MVDQWVYASYFLISIFSPQTAVGCEFREPPVFTHPRCSHFEMAEWYVYIRTGIMISGKTYSNNPTFPIGGVTIYHHQSYSDLAKGARVGSACLTMNSAAPQIDEDALSNWSSPQDINEAAPNLDTDIPILPDGAPTPSEGFPNWEAQVSLTFDGPFNTGQQSCEECDCVDIPDKWSPACLP